MFAAALVSCILLPQLEPQTEHPHRGSPELTPSTLNESRPSGESGQSKTFLLRFPNYWVVNGRCQAEGTQTLLLSQRGDRIDGKLSWIWNDINDAATITGTITQHNVSMTLIPPSIGGFRLVFNGDVDTSASQPPSSFSGTVDAQDTCRRQDGVFTLTALTSAQPSPQSLKQPLFQKPFELEYLMTNYFDHQVPRQFQDNNGYFVTWTGKALPLGSPGASIDGHAGYDWSTPEGTPLLAVADGVVHTAGESSVFYCPPLEKEISGLDVYLEHTAPNGDRFSTEYVHLSQIDVKPGQSVKAGDVIGLSGNTGCSTGPHLHFGVYRISKNQQWTIVDPYGWSSSDVDPWSQDSDGTESPWLWKDGEAPILYEYGR